MSLAQMSALGAIALTTAITLVACGGESADNGASGSGESSASDSGSSASDFEPVTIDNCGTEFTIEQAPQRATTLEQGATDTLLMLGAADQIAGHSHYKSHPPAGYEDETEQLTLISEDPATSEQLRAADTDFIYSPFELSWDESGAGTREEWAQLGVPTFNNNTECQEYGDNKGKTQFELLERDFTELGQIFGRQDEAQALIKKQNEALEDASDAQAPEGTTFMMLYSAYESDPYVAGGPSILTEMGGLFGMTNVFADVDEEWPTVSWEAVAEANPDVIILGDLPLRGSPGDKWEEKVEILETTPAVQNMDAVKNKKYIVIDGITASASVRTHEGVVEIADALRDGVLDDD
ncbi:ABC transporter substrate-binding protein [Corynebacterium cystitidis]|uniref:ABC transporter substrate-binding protein n=1 Tax=Corynebacterium cystitidis TaxID=35757 RepID=UPI00211F08E0|nr:ABC transporter substrate-binding protein [Corynebacterium cystitidis]